MRQASWGELFAPRALPIGIEPEVPAEPRGWRRLVWWEDLLTFGLMGVILLAVIASIQGANWVDTMPSLYPIAFFGLFLGAIFARIPWREGFIHLMALAIGAMASLGQIMSILPGDTPLARWDVLHDRMAAWVHIAVYGGISNDDLPFIVLVVPLVWVTSYLSAWAVFRWQNVWLAIVPAGTVLLVNISFLPGHFRFSFVIYLLGAVLLATRMHLLERAKAWRARQTPYPPLLSLSVLHATFWLALVLLGLAWLMPQANKSGALESLWNKSTAPATDRATGLARLFTGVNNKKSYQIHDFGDILPFLGSIKLPDQPVADISVTTPLDQQRFLRAAAYDVYTAHGWEADLRIPTRLAASSTTNVDRGLEDRLPIIISVLTQNDGSNNLLTVGQPLSASLPSVAQGSGSQSQVTSLVSPSALSEGESYQSSGSVSTATEEQLRAAGTDYPAALRDSLFSIPSKMPDRVHTLARSWATGQTNPYDKAVAIESNLRTQYPYDLNVQETPPGRDTVDYFLFDLERGYFDYHASAMVVMLRSLGIPARLGVGYVIDPRSVEPGSTTYHITEANAYAWPEVYFPGFGWVEFNPTPDHPATTRPGSLTEVDSRPLSGALGNIPTGDANIDSPGVINPEVNHALVPANGSDSHMGWIIAGAAGLVALLIASGTAGARYAWVRGLSGLDTPSRLWGQTVRLAGWSRAGSGADQTPREFARTLRAQVPGTDGVEVLADSYVRHRYGRGIAGPAEQARLEVAWRSVRRSLVRRLLRLS